jgi:hypothetical protein
VSAGVSFNVTRTTSATVRLIDPFLPKLEEWMEASKGKVRADVAHESCW